MFSMHIETRIQVIASAMRTREVLFNFRGYDLWNPTSKEFVGECVVGQPIRFKVQRSEQMQLSLIQPCRARA